MEVEIFEIFKTEKNWNTKPVIVAPQNLRLDLTSEQSKVDFFDKLCD